MSKYYGESERLLGKVFSLANDLSTGAIIFLDEVKGLIIDCFSQSCYFDFYSYNYLQFTYTYRFYNL